MKKNFLILILIVFSFVMHVNAKTTYIPTYNNRLMLVEDGAVDSVMNTNYSLSMPSKDGLITCTISQQIVSEDLVRDIKRAKNAAGWGMVVGAMSAVHEGFAMHNMNRGNKGWAMFEYVHAREMTDASFAMSAESRAQADDLKTLLLDLIVTNNSQKEMLITDMDRGIVFFVLPNSAVNLPLFKDEEFHFRISSCNPLDENVKYINAWGTSTLEKYTIDMETDVSWYVPISNKAVNGLRFTTDKKDGYIKVDKESLKMSFVSEEDFKKLKDQK